MAGPPQPCSRRALTQRPRPARRRPPRRRPRRPRPRRRPPRRSARRRRWSPSPGTAGATASAWPNGARTATPLHGLAYDKILAHYYPGTTLGQARVATVRVLVASRQKVTLVLDHAVDDRRRDRGEDRSRSPGSSRSTPTLTVDGTQLQPPLKRRRNGAAVGRRDPVPRHARGRDSTASSCDVVDTVGLEQYLKGVVPSEMPSKWPPAALQAQAVAARSYALANLTQGTPVRSLRRHAQPGVRRRRRRVARRERRRRRRRRDGSSSTAARSRTRSSSRRRAAAPCRRSRRRESTCRTSSRSPIRTTRSRRTTTGGPCSTTRRPSRSSSSCAAPIADLSVGDRRRPGGVKSARRRRRPTTRRSTLTGNQVRHALGLRSTWFSPALLQLSPAATHDHLRRRAFAARASVRGARRSVARGEAVRAAPGQTRGRCRSRRTGRSRSSSSRRCRRSTGSRGATRAPGLAKIGVAARVSAVVTPQGVQGTLRPVATGAPVQLQQRQDDGTWTTLASTSADAAVRVVLRAARSRQATYRVRGAHRATASAPGVSAPFTVQ